MLCGTAKSLKLFGSFFRRLTLGSARSDALVDLGPAKSFFFASKRYQADGSFFASAWTPASSP